MKPAPPTVLRATRLLDQVRERIRDKHYSLRTEQAYVQWVRAFVKWHGLRHRHPHGAGVARAFGREDDDDLHPCLEGRCRSDLQPVGYLGLATG